MAEQKHYGDDDDDYKHQHVDQRHMDHFSFRLTSEQPSQNDNCKLSCHKHLHISKEISENECFINLKHGVTDEKEGSSHCRVYPIHPIEHDTHFIHFKSDIHINTFLKAHLDEFLRELSTILNLDSENVHCNCYCVVEGSSKIVVAMRNVKGKVLKRMTDAFAKPTAKINNFIKKFKLNIKETLDMTRKTFKQKIVKYIKPNPTNPPNNLTLPQQQQVFTEWMRSKVDNLYPLMYKKLKYCEHDFQIIDAMVVDVPDRLNAFKKFKDYENSLLLYHGTKVNDFASIIEKGFLYFKGSKGKFYGKGFYFSSFPEYSLAYAKMGAQSSTVFTLIGSLVNVGKVDQIYKKIGNKNIKKGYNSNYIRVFGTGGQKYLPAHIDENDKLVIGQACICGVDLVKCNSNTLASDVVCNNCGKTLPPNKEVYHCSRGSVDLPDHANGYNLDEECFILRENVLIRKETKFAHTNDFIYDEYCVSDSDRILPRYLINFKKVEKVFVWRNTTYEKYPNAPIYKKISKQNVVYVCKDTLSALKVIEIKKNSSE
eukprot:420828_1